ncbi:Type 1 glutamine amidotransferase-like domain-containing protein [Pseudalkalibacillus hwajinpoensis]|uniref:Type 1 glutamine amidotransferase-like domain-containing protein n=1 Tax=Guptibacillus hwajinpoensis TaxID=208199 RepID=UPI00325AE088
MGNLILSGGGNVEQNFRVHDYFVKSIDKDKPLLYIPLAGDPGFRSYDTSLKYVQSIFNPLGIGTITMWTELKNKTLSELKHFSAVYFSGGCTLTLLKALKKSNFDKILIQFYESGGTIFGQSAGAIIFGSNISHTYSRENILAESEPLNLIHNYRLWCHYNAQHDELIYEFSEDGRPPFIALTEGGLFVLLILVGKSLADKHMSSNTVRKKFFKIYAKYYGHSSYNTTIITEKVMHRNSHRIFNCFFDHLMLLLGSALSQ